MIGTQTTGAIQGVVISAVAHEDLRVDVNGKPGRLAIISEDGSVIAAGPDVAREAAAVAINSYRQFMQGKGFLRVLSKPITTDAANSPSNKRQAAQ